MATRIFELARELGVTSKVVLEKCNAEGITLKNHMAVLSAGLEATIREWFTEGSAATAVETTAHVDLDKARAEAKKHRRREGKDELAPPLDGGEAAVGTEETPAEAPAEAPIVVEAPQPIEAPVAAPVAPPAVKPPPVQPAPVAEVVVVAPPAAEPVAAPVAAVAPPAPAALVAAVAPVVPAAPVAPVIMSQGPSMHTGVPVATPPGPAVPPRKAGVQPAGPQLVPRPAKLRGPRVVRMETPEIIRPPMRRPPPPQQAQPPLPGDTTRRPPKPGVVVTEDEEDADKKKTKRSPRRRGGRSADSGEKVKEWRNQDLAERTERLAAASGGLRRHRTVVGRGKGVETGQAIKVGPVEIEEPVTVKSFSGATGIRTSDIIGKLLSMGAVATVNQVVEHEKAIKIALEYGVELTIRQAKTNEEKLMDRLAARAKAALESRAPVVTFLGHVDHGKTSLLDRIRDATVASGEAGGITQHIGAYRYDKDNRHVVFLDTPGHEAFTSMRARGANMTDVVVLVVAADDGVMPQTIEAISHAKAAKVPIIVAMNKIDMPAANATRVLGQLAEHGLNPRQWGGDVEVIETSAVTGQGMDTLVETLSLEAELLELKAEVDAPASGYIIEAKMDPGRGALARVLVLNGTLKVGDIVLAGKVFGRVRQMIDHRGGTIVSAGPSTPLEVAGLDEIPEAGDKFFVVKNMEDARQISEERLHEARAKELASSPARTLEGLLGKIEAGKANELALIIKADVQGSIEALVESLKKLSTSEVRVNILHAIVGGINIGDVALAEASDAIIIGFNVVPDAAARQAAETKGVDIRLYRIIYEIIDDIRRALEKGLAPEIRTETIGRAEVRQAFKVSRVGTIAGCFVTDGVINRSSKVRITRNSVVVGDERTLESLKRFKDDVREVRAGMECGLKIAGYDDIKEGDTLEFYQKTEVARTL